MPSFRERWLGARRPVDQDLSMLRITISLVDEHIPHKLTIIQLEELYCRQCGKVAGGARISSELHRPTLVMVSLFPTRSKI